MRIAQDRAAQQLGVGVDLAGRVEAAPGVVEVHLVGGVEAAVLLLAQGGEAAVAIEGGKAGRERPLRRFEAVRPVARWYRGCRLGADPDSPSDALEPDGCGGQRGAHVVPRCPVAVTCPRTVTATR